MDDDRRLSRYIGSYMHDSEQGQVLYFAYEVSATLLGAKHLLRQDSTNGT